MNIRILIGLLLVALVYGEDDSGKRTLSEECMAELRKYKNCFDKIGFYNILIEDTLSGGDVTKELDIAEFCQVGASDRCRIFVDDVSNSKSDCLSKDNPNHLDTMMGVLINELKKAYLIYCWKGSDEEYCPISNYAITHQKELKDKSETILTDANKLPDELKEVIAKDCIDPICNERMITAFDGLAETLNAFSSLGESTKDNYNESENSFIGSYIKDYRDKTCNNIYDVPPFIIPTKECKKEVEEYSLCFKKIEIDIEGEMLDYSKLCKAENWIQCQYMVKDINKDTTKCISKDNSNMMDMTLGVMILGIKSTYRILCSKGSNDEYCPLSDYMMNNQKEFEKLGDTIIINNTTALPDEIKKIIANDCSDTKCNERMISGINAINKATNLMAGGTGDPNEKETQNNIVGSYITDYRAKTCDKIYATKKKQLKKTDEKTDEYANKTSDATKLTIPFIEMIIWSLFLLF